MKVDDSAASFDPAELLGGKPATYARKGGSWAINAMRDTAERLPRNAVLATAAPLPAPVGAELKVSIDHLDGTIGQGIGRFRVWVTDRADPLEVAPCGLLHLKPFIGVQETGEQVMQAA